MEPPSKKPRKNDYAGSSLPYEAFLVSLSGIYILFLEANRESKNIRYRIVVSWLFRVADETTEHSARAVQCRDTLYALYKECYCAKTPMDTFDQFQDHLLRNTYASQCFLIVRKLVQIVPLSQTTLDCRAADVLIEHLRRTASATAKPLRRSDAEPTEALHYVRARYNCRTILVDALFPASNGGDKSIPPPLYVLLYVSCLHTSLLCNVGPLRQRTTKANELHFPAMRDIQSNTEPRLALFRVGKPPNKHCGPVILSKIITRLLNAWDAFARFLGWRSLDLLITPYMCVHWDTLRLKPVPDLQLAVQQKPVAHVKQQALEPVFPSPDTCAEFACVLFNKRDPSARVESQNVDPDAFLRQVTKAFIDQLYKFTLKNTFFSPNEADNENVTRFVDHHITSVENEKFAPCITTVIDMAQARKFQNFHSFLLASGDIKDTSYAVTEPRRSLVARRRSSLPQQLPLHMAPQQSSSNSDATTDKGALTTRRTTPLDSIPEETSPCEPDCMCNSALNRVRTYLSEFARLYNCHFADLLTTDDTLGGEAPLYEAVQLVLTDPPYNIRRENNRINSAYDTLSRRDMVDCVDTITAMLRPGGHVVLFCSAVQWHVWRRVFLAVEDDSRNVYQVDSVPMTFVSAPGHSIRRGSRHQFALRNTAEYALHAFKALQPGSREEALTHVKYENHGYVPSTQPGYSATIDNVPRLDPGERVHYTTNSSDGRSAFLRAEQKGVATLKEVISRFTAPKDIVVDLFAGTFSTAVAALTAREHRIFVGCDLDELCYQKGQTRLIDTFAYMVHSASHIPASSDIDVPQSIKDDAIIVYDHITFKRATTLFKSSSIDSRWKPPGGLPLAQNLSQGVRSGIAKMLLNSAHVEEILACTSLEVCEKLFTLLESKPPSNWPLRLYAALSVLPPVALVMCESESFGVIVKNDRYGEEDNYIVAANKNFSKNSLIGTISGSLVYRNLIHDVHHSKTKCYGTGFFSVSPDRFKDMALSVVPSQKNGLMRANPQEIFLVPAPFSCLQYAMLLDVHSASPNAKAVNRLHNKVVSHRSMITAHNVVEVVATKNIRRYEHITIDCSSLNVF